MLYIYAFTPSMLSAEGSVVDPGAPPGLECVKGLIEALPRAPVDPRVRQVDHPIPKWTAR